MGHGHENIGDGEIRLGQEAQITAGEVGPKVTFAGHGIDTDLTLSSGLMHGTKAY